MDDAAWRRAGAGAGVIGAVLYAVSAFVAGSPLKPDDVITKVVAHLADKRSALLVGSLLASIALAFLLWFLGNLRALLARAEGAHAPLATVTVAAWITLFAIIGSGAAPLTAIVWRGAATADPRTVQLAFDASNLSLYSLSAVAALLSVLAPIIVIWRRGVLPRWLVALGALEIAANVVELAGLFSRTGANTAGYAAGVGPFLWVLWVAALSLTMVVNRPTRAEPVQPPGVGA